MPRAVHAAHHVRHRARDGKIAGRDALRAHFVVALVDALVDVGAAVRDWRSALMSLIAAQELRLRLVSEGV